ncbi:hypothetical protein [Streptomyces cyaneofuscatus]|uniref:hypothetical protein n=1 Tax=Streptomyces cyaneofuscatus TaxID=66883 RepID=UPI0036484D7E
MTRKPGDLGWPVVARARGGAGGRREEPALFVQPQRAALPRRDDLADGGPEQRVAAAQRGERQALDLAADEGAQAGEDQEVAFIDADLVRSGRGEERFDDGGILGGGQP